MKLTNYNFKRFAHQEFEEWYISNKITEINSFAFDSNDKIFTYIILNPEIKKINECAFNIDIIGTIQFPTFDYFKFFIKQSKIFYSNSGFNYFVYITFGDDPTFAEYTYYLCKKLNKGLFDGL